MGSTGSGRFTDYTGSGSATGKTGGMSGTDKCSLSFSCLLDEVAQSSYFSMHNSLPDIGSTILIQQGRPRIIAIDTRTNLDCGALPTQFNYLAGCLNEGHSYIGIITNVSNFPVPLIQVDVSHD